MQGMCPHPPSDEESEVMDKATYEQGTSPLSSLPGFLGSPELSSESCGKVEVSSPAAMAPTSGTSVRFKG